MRVWNNNKHEQVLREKKMKRLEAKQKPQPHYDTSDLSGNKNNSLSTDTAYYGNRVFRGQP